jgi:hypothetical protein
LIDCGKNEVLEPRISRDWNRALLRACRTLALTFAFIAPIEGCGAPRAGGDASDVSLLDAHDADAVTPADAPVSLDVSSDMPDSPIDAGMRPSLPSARVFGYTYGDGNYFPPLVGPPPGDARLDNGSAAIRDDFLAAACAAGYAGSIVVGPSPGRLYDCATHLPVSAAPWVVRGFAWPFAADFTRFVQDATPEEKREFVAAFITGEASRCGIIDDQSCGFGGYNDGARINTKMQQLAMLMQSIGFTTATVTTMAGGGSTACTGTGRVDITMADFCRFNSANGFRFATYARVPGSICAGIAMCMNGDISCTEPPPCH